MRRTMPWLALLLIAGLSTPARAVVTVGDPAPAFTKNQLILDPTPQTGPPVSLSDFAGRVLILHLIGYS